MLSGDSPTVDRIMVGQSATVLVVDDHPVVRRGLTALLAAEDWIDRIVQASTFREALAAATECRPQVALVDIRLPDGDGIDLIRKIRTAVPDCACVALTMESGGSMVRGAIEAGATGYLVKDEDPDLVLEGVRTAAMGGFVLGKSVAASRLSLVDEVPTTLPEPFRALTTRERDLVEHVAMGHGNQRIAHVMGVSEKTVRNSLSNILTKVGARDRVHLAVTAREAGLRGSNDNGTTNSDRTSPRDR